MDCGIDIAMNLISLGDVQGTMTAGLANDQLGYLIAPARYVPVIAAQAPVAASRGSATRGSFMVKRIVAQTTQRAAAAAPLMLRPVQAFWRCST